jgi:hypothetical protein
MTEMEANIKWCLDEVSHLPMVRYANSAAQFVSAYAAGFTGTDLGYIKKKYKSHQILPPHVIREIRDSIHT